MSEFSLIKQYCQNIGSDHADTCLGVGDDAAVISTPSNMNIAVSVDTMVEGVHFLAGVEPARLAQKLMAVNLSDMAAMGAQPRWATLALTLPEQDNAWLSAFSNSLDRIARYYEVQLIGGDTTQGPLTLSLQMMGLLPNGCALTRAGAKVGDEVYVSNTIGDAALALQCIQSPHRSGKLEFTPDELEALIHALECPQPQVSLGLTLLGLANACIDISDGLIADLEHISQQSQVSIKLDMEKLPLSKQYNSYLKHSGDLNLALNGGDDYQLAFTIPPECSAILSEKVETLNVSVTKIGSVIKADKNKVKLYRDGVKYAHNVTSGYQHFSKSTE